MKLYQLTAQYQSLLHRFDEDEPFDLEKELESSKDALEEKLDSCGWVYRTLEAEAKAYKEEADRLAKKAKSAAANAERLKNYVASCLQGTATKTKSFAFSFRPSEAVEVFDESILPEAYWRTVTKTEPNKELIKQDLKSGAQITGAGLLKNSNLQIK